MERSLDDGADQEPPEDGRIDVSEFVEVDPTGRYGRVWRLSTFSRKIISVSKMKIHEFFQRFQYMQLMQYRY
jgi:hypothetical protein